MERTEFQRDDHKERSIAHAKAIAAAVCPGNTVREIAAAQAIFGVRPP
jgi:hypothetical protein